MKTTLLEGQKMVMFLPRITLYNGGGWELSKTYYDILYIHHLKVVWIGHFVTQQADVTFHTTVLAFNFSTLIGNGKAGVTLVI